jgi:epoxyqueuosine reductase
MALGNWGYPAAVPVLARALSDPEPLVRAHAAWSLGRVGSAEANSALSAHALVETDACVLEELSECPELTSVLGSEPRRFSQRSITDSESS